MDIPVQLLKRFRHNAFYLTYISLNLFLVVIH